MKLTELHDDAPLLIGVLNGLLKKPGTRVNVEFRFTLAIDPKVVDPELVDGLLYRIERERPGVYSFSLTNAAAMPNHISLTSRSIDRMHLKQTGENEWLLSYTEGA